MRTCRCGKVHSDLSTFCDRCGELIPEEACVAEPALMTSMPAIEADASDRASHVEVPVATSPQSDLKVGSTANYKRRSTELLMAFRGRGDSPLPDHERKQGWTIDGKRSRFKGFDCWPVTNRDGRAGRFTQYRLESMTSPALYEHITRICDPSLVRLESYGTGGSDQLAYEITALPRGRLLTHWLQDHCGQDAAKALYRPILSLIRLLRSHGLHAISLNPDMLSIDGEKLSLTIFGALREGSDSRVHEYFAGSPLLPQPWSEPDLVLRTVTTSTSDLFSAGQIVASAFFGRPPSHESLLYGRVQFQQIDDVETQRFLTGVLWPREAGRWDLGDVDDSSAVAPPWASLRPGAASGGYALGGSTFWHAADLLTATANHWEEATANFPALTAWLETTPQAALVRGLSQYANRSVDWKLVRLCTLIMPDAPPFWRRYDFSDPNVDRNLTALGQAILRPPDDASLTDAVSDIEALFTMDLRGSFSSN